MRRIFLGTLVLGLAVVAGCATERPTRSYVQPNYVDKAVFQGEWFFRQTIADVPSTTRVTFTGESSSLEKIRWEIQEKFLVAYRSYELMPGTDNQADQENKGPDGTRFAEGQAEGRTDGFREQPIAAYPIESHFDIFRQYNSTTGEEINVLEENTKDNPWYNRRYVRVDWSKNQVVNFFMLSPLEGKWYVQDSEGGREKFRLAYQKDAAGKDRPYYFDFVTKLFVDPDWYGCVLTYYGYAAEDCTSAEVKVRSSFLKVDGPREFEPVQYDDRKMSKFGYFRTERLTYNRVRGITQTGRIYLANVHNTFGKVYERDANNNILYADNDGRQVFYTQELGFHYRDNAGQPVKDSAGKVAVPPSVRPLFMPVEKRPLKPIVYHLSPRYPQAMIQGAELVAQSWNVAFRKAAAASQNRNVDDGSFRSNESCEVAHGQGQCGDNGAGGYCKFGNQCDPIPDMFVLNYNGWVKRVDGIAQEFTDYHPTRDAAHGQSGATVSWTYNTQYEVAQIGDLRYSVIYWVDQPQIAGPLGYGPSAADPETGEIVSGTAYVYGAAVDTYATYALDIIRTLNGQMSIDDLTSGQTVVDYIRRNLDRADPRAKFTPEMLQMSMAAAKAKMLGPQKLAKLDLVREYGLEPARPGRHQEFMRRIQESGLDNLLINEEIRIAKSRGLYNPGMPLTQDEKARINLSSWASPQHMILRTKARHDKARRNNLMLAEFADDGVAGLALKYAQRQPSDLEDGGAVWQELRTLIYRAVMEHEVGHTIGLRHNFQGSFDALNYFPQYWQLRKENLRSVSQIVASPSQVGAALDMASLTQNQKDGSMHEYMYSTVMDYASRFNSDVHGVGKYDVAAILFAYGRSVEVFDFNASVIDPNVQGLIDFSANKPSPIYDSLTEMIHYTQLPYHFGGGNVDQGLANMSARRVVRWDQLEALRNSGSPSVPLEVPYMFCSDDWVGAIGSCQLWDTGADHYEIVQDVISRYKNYYFFNNFKRDRHLFWADQVLERVFARYLIYLPNLYQHWLFSQFYSSSIDGLGDLYWTISTFDGLNMIGEVLTTPEYGSYSLDSQTNLYRWTGYNSGSGDIYIPQGEGRRTYSRYDLDSGYYLFDRTLEAGHFWDYLAGVFALVQTDATVLGVETVSDFTTYLIPYYLVFEEETTRLVNGIYGKDHFAIAPRINPSGQMVMYPAVDINGTNAAPAGTPIELDINFTKQIYAMLYGMAFFTSNFSLHYPDQAQVFRLGAGEQVTPGAGYELVQFTDPLTGHAYGALKAQGVEASTVAAKLVTKGANLATQYNSLLGNPAGQQQLQSVRFQLEDLVTDLNLLRSLYSELARVF